MIWDVFPFHDELEILEARVTELEGLVDYHILVEGYQTFRGEPKRLYYRNRNPGWGSRVLGWAVPLPANTDNWGREHFQRDVALSLLAPLAEPDDVIISTDVDELISAEAVTRIVQMTQTGAVCLSMDHLYYNLDWQVPGIVWNHGKAFRWSDRPESLSALRETHENLFPYKVENAGWHLAWFGGPKARVRKLASFSHEELDTPDNRKRMHDWDESPTDALGSPLVRYDGKVSDTITDILKQRGDKRA